MAHIAIIDMAQAAAIIHAYNHCGHCDTCPLDTPEGWRCSYLHDQAAAYIAAHKEDNNHA